jgi:hypothetical protein
MWAGHNAVGAESFDGSSEPTDAACALTVLPLPCPALPCTCLQLVGHQQA